MLARWGIRLASSLIGIAVGFLLSAAIVSSFSISATALVESTIIFWVVHIFVQVMALRVLVRQPSVALAGLLALLATIVSLLVVNAIVSGFTIHGPKTYIPVALIIWVTTALADTLGRRMIRDRRRD
jgi:hypothetical protein